MRSSLREHERIYESTRHLHSSHSAQVSLEVNERKKILEYAEKDSEEEREEGWAKEEKGRRQSV